MELIRFFRNLARAFLFHESAKGLNSLRGALRREILFDEFLKPFPAIGRLARAGMPAVEPQIMHNIVSQIQQANQGDLFPFTFRFRLLQQRNRIASLDKAFSGERGNMLKIIMAQTTGIGARLGVVFRCHHPMAPLRRDRFQGKANSDLRNRK